MIYLSSYRIGHHSDYLRSPHGCGRAAIICNALDGFGDTRLQNWEREASDLARLGYAVEELDLRQYFGNAAGLARNLERFDLVWVLGGNAFVLARAMTASGFGEALASAMDSGLMYAGYSAGACVAGPDLRGIHLMDAANDLPPGYDAKMPAHSLALVPFRIVPHWRSDHPETAQADAAVRWLVQNSLEYRALRDGEVVVVDNHGQAEVRS